jgi:hypothetical protein
MWFPRHGNSRILAGLITSSGRLNLHSRIDGHHIIHWPDGGRTEVDNLVHR